MDLPIRNRSHINDTNAQLFFQSSLPSEWVTRKIDLDYGIDFEIEIWEDEKPNGRKCFVQLKHKEKLNYQFITSLKIKRSTLNYLNQSENSFIIINHEENFAIARVKELCDIYINKIIPDNKSDEVYIPMVFRRVSDSINYQLFVNEDFDARRLTVIIGALKEFPYFYKGLKKTKTAYYYKDFPTESDFWKKETYANLGYYFSVVKKNKNNLLKKLVALFPNEDRWGKLGILDAFEFLSFRNKETQAYSQILKNSEHYLEVLSSIYFMSLNGDEKYINEIDAYFNSPSMASPLSDFDEIETTEIIAMKSISIINTPKAVDYIFGSFISENVFINYSVRGIFPSLLIEMGEKDIKIKKYILEKIKNQFPDYYEKTKVVEFNKIVNGLSNIINFDEK